MTPDPQNTKIECMIKENFAKNSIIQLAPFTYCPAPLAMVVQIGVTRWHKHIDSAM